MYQTKYGSFNGTSWEGIMQICFRLKYENEHYQAIPASSGDSGIEGFTKTGKVFQCFCPDNNITSKALYEKQRDKITEDLGKLSLYESKLQRFLGPGIKIKEWIFVTPEYRMNDLIVHCNTKRQEILDQNLSIIDSNFQIVLFDINCFIKELRVALTDDGQQLFLPPESMDTGTFTQWKDQEIDLVSNAVRKHSKRFSSLNKTTEAKVNTLTDATIQGFLDRETILRKWQQIFPEDYDKFLFYWGKSNVKCKKGVCFLTAIIINYTLN
jgi:hypothetical protein